MVKSIEKQSKEKKKKKDIEKEFAARRLIQMLALNPKIPVSIQDKVKEVTSQKDAMEHSLPWIQQIISVLGKVPKSATATIRARKGVNEEALNPRIPVAEQKKGGIVQKFSRGGAVNKPRGVGIAKRGYGKVIR